MAAGAVNVNENENENENPLIVIVGPTASGKTSLAIKVAQQFSGEIISADSRAIYRGLDIGTAKPSMKERDGVVHWGFDLVNPGERFTVADFKRYADAKIVDIRLRGKVPILVGGTGLYIDSVIYDYTFTAASNDLELRTKFEQKSLADLQNYCNKHNIKLPENNKNKRYIINAIARNGALPQKNTDKYKDKILVGIMTDKTVLKERIRKRAKTIVNDTTINEAVQAAQTWGWDNEAMTGNVYPLIRKYVAGKLTHSELEEKFCTLDWRLAKRQLTWLRRNSEIAWYDLERAYSYIAQRLADR